MKTRPDAGLPASSRLTLPQSPLRCSTVHGMAEPSSESQATPSWWIPPVASTVRYRYAYLDYRHWYAFGAERRQKERWERFTRQRYGTGSGGEKALMRTIPQMAAASFHYLSAAPHAPRLILLDEAFAGMDKPTRARCMGLLDASAFDLDLLMTSEREWGAHASVAGIAIYQLLADDEAISATRWVWNGRVKRLAPVPDTPRAAPDRS